MLLFLLVAALLLAWWLAQPSRTVAYTMDALPVLLPREHIHEPEQLPGWSHTFRWTTNQTRLQPANPGGQVVLRIILGGGPDRNVPVSVQTGTQVQSFLVGAAPRTYALLLPLTQRERITLTIESPTIREHRRTLGVMVSDIRLSGGGAMPGSIVLALLVATASGYLLLLRSGIGPRPAGGIILAIQFAGLLWYAAGGWRYAIAGSALWLASLAALATVGIEWIQHKTTPVKPSSSSPSPHLLSHQERGAAEHGSPSPLGEEEAGEGGERRNASPRLELPLILAIALLIRLPLLVAADPVGDLELAARRMWFLHNDGLAGAYIYNGDYMPLRLYLLYGLSHLVALFGGDFHDPLPPITLVAIKFPGLLADLATITIIYRWSRHFVGKPHTYLEYLCSLRFTYTPISRITSLSLPAMIALLYACSPPVWINVAWWGQVDALLMLPLVGAVVLLERNDGVWSWVCWIIALLIKPQAIVFAPLLFAATIRLHGSRGLVRGGGLAVAIGIAACVPLVVAHQGPGLMQAYLGSVGRFPKLTIGAYNLWHLLTWGHGGNDDRILLGLLTYRTTGMLLVGSAAALVMLAMVRRADARTRTVGAAVLGLAFFVLPTQIHERYLFLPMAFLALSIIHNERVVLAYVVIMLSATINILGTLDGFVPLAHTFISASPLPLVCAAANLIVLGALVRSCLTRGA